jgi:hypothetical protein
LLALVEQESQATPAVALPGGCAWGDLAPQLAELRRWNRSLDAVLQAQAGRPTPGRRAFESVRIRPVAATAVRP